MVESVRLFVVDDSEDDCLLYRRALSANPDISYVIEEAHDGDSAVDRIACSLPDCVLLDYSLPGRNGIEVLKRIRANHAFVPVLMLTGQGSETVAVAAMQQGAQNYLSKGSIDPERIHRAIQIAIAHCAMEKRLHEQRTSLQIFTRALAHDLKEPVRTVRSFLSVLAQTETLTEKGRDYFAFVESAADRMVSLIDAVYDYTRLDGSAPPPRRENCDAGAVLREAQGDIAELVSERGALITSGPLPIVSADAHRLRQVFQNLICNAIHHCAETPKIEIAAEERSDHWIVTVTDNGPGVAEDIRQRIFEPFTRMTSGNGLGMGLAISQRIVEAHGGKIWCDAGPTGGARFSFTLRKGAEASGAPSKGKEVATPLASLLVSDDLATILIVDDNEAAIELARITLLQGAKLRCNLVSAASGEEALVLVRQAASDGGRIDLILLDINMPRMDGFQLLKMLQDDTALAKFPIIMCSTSTYDRDVERANALGATGFVEKPPQIDKLRPLLRNAPRLRLEDEEKGCALMRVA